MEPLYPREQEREEIIREEPVLTGQKPSQLL